MNTNILFILIILLLAVNAIAFFLYGLDKYKAKHSQYRIPETTLLLLAYIGGAYGAFLGMQIWRHKTHKTKFQILVPLAVILWTLIIFILCLWPWFYQT